MKKILVTGATGFVGCYVVDQLMRSGYHVIASSSNKISAATKGWFDKVTYVEFDLRNFDTKQNYFEFFHQPVALLLRLPIGLQF